MANKRDFDGEFKAIVGEQLSVEDLQEIASQPDIQFFVGRKIVRSELLGLNTKYSAGYIALLESEVQEQLDAILKDLRLDKDKREIVLGLAEDMARKTFKRYGF